MRMIRNRRFGAFLRLVGFSLLSLYLVILAGGIVRSSGAGMGCPDWPLCFGRLIPPLSEDQLPPDYEERYAVEGRPAVFNAFHTWVEYVNRLLGVVAGLALLAQTLVSLSFLKTRKSFFFLSSSALFLTGLEGFLGAKVVASYLQPFLVSLHLGLALVICAVQLYLWFSVRAQHRWNRFHDPDYTPSERRRLTLGPPALGALAFLTLATLVQITLGSRLRETFDAAHWNHEIEALPEWIDHFGGIFDLHRYGALLLLAAALLFLFSALKTPGPGGKKQRLFGVGILGVLLLQGLVGYFLQIFGLPEELKPLHLVLANLLLFFELSLIFGHVFPPRAKMTGEDSGPEAPIAGARS